MRPAIALFGFHARSGARLALRAGIPAAALATAAIGLGPDPGATLRFASRNLASATRSPAVAVVLTLVAMALAVWAVPRLRHGMRGWMRHLPADRRSHRRALVGAVVVAQLPVAVAWTGLWLLAWGHDAEPIRLAALPVVLLGVALAASGSRRAILPIAAGLATVALALVGRWPAILAAAALVALAERWVEPESVGTSRGLLWRVRVGPRLLPALIAYRALGVRVLTASLPALIPLAVAWMFATNNTGLAVAGPIRLAACCSVAIVFAGLAEELASRRPPWRWARSLGQSASRRVFEDAAWLSAHTLPWLVAFGGLLDLPAALAAAATVPLIALRAASALRRPHRAGTTATRVVAEGLFIAAWLGVTAWTLVPAVVLVWPAWAEACRRDRNLDVSRWSPMDHLAAGDPTSWTGA